MVIVWESEMRFAGTVGMLVLSSKYQRMVDRS